MKNLSFKIISIVCVLVLLFNMGEIVYASNGQEKFVLLNISVYNENGEELIKENNVFYIRNNTLFAPIKTFEEYTMYNYDDSNCAFVRVGQNYKNSNSKVVIDYNNSKIEVFYLGYQKESYDIDVYKFGDTYFFPLDKMASYLKASVIFKDYETISILNSGVSISDALYNYEPYDSCLDYFDIKDDIFAGDEFLAKSACVLGYFGETVFSFKVSNLMGEYGDYKKYIEILKNAVTNNECYEEVFNNDDLLSDTLGVTEDIYNELYKKSTTVYNMSANSIATMFEEHKAINSFGDDSPFDNFLPEEQAEIDKINSFGKYISAVDTFIDTFSFYYDFYKLNEDNKDAIERLGSLNDYDTRALAMKEIAKLYGNDVVESSATKLYNDISEELMKESIKNISGELFSGANKVKLATGIVDAVFKTAGFDLSDNSGYNVMLADQLKSYVLKNLGDSSVDNLNTQDNFDNMRLTYILGLLIDIESYKMGNKLADKYDNSGYYDDKIEEANKRLALFYLAKDSEKYDTVEGMKKIYNQNKTQVDKMDFEVLDSISTENAISFLSSLSRELDFQKRQWNSNNSAGFDYDEDNFYYYKNVDKDTYEIILKKSSGEENTIVSNVSSSFVVNGGSLYYIKNKKIYKSNLYGENEKVVFDPQIKDNYIYIANLIPLDSYRLLVVIELGDGAGGTAELDIININTGKCEKIDISGKYAGNYYTYGDFLYYQESDYDFDSYNYYNDKLVRFNLNTNEKEYVDIDFDGRSIQGILGSYLYSTKRPDADLIENDWIKSITIPIYKLDLKTLKESVVDTYQSNEPVHGILIYNDKVFLSSGTGAGNGFAVLEDGTLNYHNENVLDHPGLLGDKMGIYNEYLICDCWDGSYGVNYGYQKIYKIE